MARIKIFGSEFKVPEPEELSFENDNGIDKRLSEFIIFRKLLSYVLRKKNNHPGDIEEVSKIASNEWKKRTPELKVFLKSYTAKVKSTTPSTGVITVTDFNLIEGNDNVVSGNTPDPYYALFLEIIDVEQCEGAGTPQEEN
ncbi:26560_t:CDS:2 [Dentiscutata erythropus]|uniref:26560_t:CDS:1 n=1 Tax=Dentiscutata erythropus TaxID=1348616 RepID=A0A9N9NRJ2_9GLOM|nr:26560_t:CDS:2 [Dentiscutata erythropus]